MATQKQRGAAKRNVETRSALGREGGKATARVRGAVIELRREATRPRLEIDGRSKWARPS